MTSYQAIPESEVPSKARFDTPRRNQGQIVEVAYADWPPQAGEAGPGSKYRMTVDRSDGRVWYAVRRD